MPLVLINRVFAGFSSVRLDSGLGIRHAVEHLASHAHRRLAPLSGPGGSWSAGSRREGPGRDRGISAAGLGPFAPRGESGAGAADGALNSGSTCCIAYTVLLAIGALHHLWGRGVAVSDQFSIVGGDDIFAARSCDSPLSSISGDLERAGRSAAELLLGTLEDPTRRPETVVLSTPLTIRASTGEAPR